MDYTRFTGFRGGRGGARGGFSGSLPSSRIPDGARTPVGVPQGGRTPAWGMASGSRSKHCSFYALCQSANEAKLQRMAARQLERQLGSRMVLPADAHLLMEEVVVVVRRSTHTMALEQRTEALRVV